MNKRIIEYLMAHPRVMDGLQWFAMGVLLAVAFLNLFTDSPYVASACFFYLGFLVAMNVMGRQYNKRLARMDVIIEQCKLAEAGMNAAREHLQRAVHEGRIEFVPVESFDDDTQPTKH